MTVKEITWRLARLKSIQETALCFCVSAKLLDTPVCVNQCALCVVCRHVSCCQAQEHKPWAKKKRKKKKRNETKPLPVENIATASLLSFEGQCHRPNAVLMSITPSNKLMGLIFEMKIHGNKKRKEIQRIHGRLPWKVFRGLYWRGSFGFDG